MLPFSPKLKNQRKMKMATAILQSQDCVRDRFRHQTLALAPPANLYPTATAGSTRSRRRKRSPVGIQANRRQVPDGRSMVVKLPSQNLVMGQVKILKRGEACSFGGGAVDGNQKAQRWEPKTKTKARAGGKVREVDLGLCSTDRLGPEPEMVRRQVKVTADGVYAGSAIFASPSPSSLPVPGFLEKHVAATSDLRRILRLDLV